MIFLEQIKRSFLNTLMLGLEGDISGSVDDKKDQAIQNNDTQISEEDQKLFKEINSLQKALEGTVAAKDITKRGYESLNKNLSKEDYNDPDAKYTIGRLEFYKKRFLEAQKEGKDVENQLSELKLQLSQLEDKYEFKKGVDISEDGKVEKNDFGIDTLKNITNREFLRLPIQKRLQYITKNHIDADKVSSGEVNDLEFTFKYGGENNKKDLYRKTTAGQVLPKEVRTVSSDGIVYERNGIRGEFYNRETNRRLIIREDTKVHIDERTPEDELKKIMDDIRSRGEKYTEGIDRKIAESALEKGIEPDMFLVCVKNNVDIDRLKLWGYDKEDTRNMEELLRNERYISAEIERHATQISRVLDGEEGIDTQGEKYDIQLAAKIISEVNPSDFKGQLIEYGYTSHEIDESGVISVLVNYSSRRFQFNRDQLASVPAGVVSSIAEKNSKGMTLCSKTARLNLHKFGLDAHQGDSAKLSFDMYNDKDIIKPDNLPPQGENIAVLDLFLDASPANREHGHRAACVKLEGSWYVLDPYYAIPGVGRTIKPIPYDTYMGVMKGKGRKIWGAAGYEKKA